jgi:hypothetical protein
MVRRFAEQQAATLASPASPAAVSPTAGASLLGLAAKEKGVANGKAVEGVGVGVGLGEKTGEDYADVFDHQMELDDQLNSLGSGLGAGIGVGISSSGGGGAAWNDAGTLLSQPASSAQPHATTASSAPNPGSPHSNGDNNSNGSSNNSTSNSASANSNSNAAPVLLEDIIAYGQELRAEFMPDPRKETPLAAELRDAFALIGYVDPAESSVARLLDPGERVRVAEELNGAILGESFFVLLLLDCRRMLKK